MIYKNSKIQPLNQLLMKLGSMNFSIQTQYKFLKIAKIINNELEIQEQQKRGLIQNYAELDQNGQVIISDDGGIKIKNEYLIECSKKIDEMNAIQITLPDIYFSLDELEPLNLTLSELELLDPFIKD